MAEISKKLSKGKFEEKVDNPETGDLVTLVTTIDGLQLGDKGKALRGIITSDKGLELPPDRNGKIKFAVVTDKIPFSFLAGSLYFIPFVSSKNAERIAYKIGRILMSGVADPILSCRITSQNLRTFLSTHKHVITDKSWRDLNIPNLNRARLTGAGIQLTSDHDRYDSHGQPFTVRLRLLSNSWSMLINTEAVVTFYNNQEQELIEGFLRDEIIPLCS